MSLVATVCSSLLLSFPTPTPHLHKDILCLSPFPFYLRVVPGLFRNPSGSSSVRSPSRQGSETVREQREDEFRGRGKRQRMSLCKCGVKVGKEDRREEHTVATKLTLSYSLNTRPNARYQPWRTKLTLHRLTLDSQ